MHKRIIGKVSSDSASKTIVITVTRRKTHPLYGKQYTVTTKYVAHDEKNEAKIGDQVEIIETRPMSKTKAFKLERIIETGHGVIELKEEEAVVEKKSTPTPPVKAAKEPKEAK